MKRRTVANLNRSESKGGTMFSRTPRAIAAELVMPASLEAEVARISDHRSLDCIEKLHGLLACLQHEMEEIQPPFVRDMQRGAPEVFALIEQRREDIIREHFGALFEESREAGMIRKDVSTTLLIAVILGAVRAVLNSNKLAELRLQPREGLRSILQIILEGAR
jgi:hypothetical protein